MLSKSSINRQAEARKQEANTFNIKNENQETNLQIEIQLSSKIIKIMFFQLCQYSKLAEDEYNKIEAQERLNKDIKLFQREYNLKDQSIETFFRIIKEENVQITNNQFRDLFKLSELFKVKTLQNYLIRYANSKLKDVNFKINLLGTSSEEIKSILPNDELSSALEQLLSVQVKECLQNENFDKLNISIIYRIIEKNQKDIKSDALYKFIAKSIDDRYILFTFLDIASLSDTNFNDLYKGYLERKNTDQNFYYQYLPNNLMYVKQLKDVMIKQYKTQNDKLTNEIKNLNSQVKNLKEQNNHLNSQLESIPPHLLMQTKNIQDLINKKEKMFKDDDNKEIDDINFETVKLIFSIFEKRSSNKTPIYLGSEAGNVDIVKYYLSKGVFDINAKYTTNNEENTALTKAIINDKIDIAKILLENDKIDPNIKSYSYNYEGKYINNRYSISVQYSEKTPLYLAIEKENVKLVQILLSCPNIDINLKSIELKHNLPDNKGQKDLKFYMENHNSETQYQQVYEKTPLYFAIEKNNIEIIKLLLEQAKIDVNMCSSYNKGGCYDNCYYRYEGTNFQKTPLFLAVETKSIEAALFLVSHPNIDLNIKSRYQNQNHGYEKTALYLAAEENNIQIVQILLSQPSIDVNLMIKEYNKSYQNKHELEKTALAIAIEKQHIDIIQYLLSCSNINVNIIFIETEIEKQQQSYGTQDYYYDEHKKEKSSLYLAIELKNFKIAQLLLKNPNIDINIKCTDKTKYTFKDETSVSEWFETALYHAIRENTMEIIKLLLNNKQIDINLNSPLKELSEQQILQLIQKK